MSSINKKILLSLGRLFFNELNYITSEDIKSLGKYKFLSQFIKSKILIRKGIRSLISPESTIIHFENIQINGNLNNSNIIRSFISSRIYLQAINGIIFDSSVLIGPDVKIISANHNSENYDLWDKDKPIIIKKNVWIGANCVILPGVTLGKNCIVGAGSIVTKSFEDNTIIGGNPAKIIKKRH